MVGVVTGRADQGSDLVILDAQRMDQGPIATVRVPVRLKYGIHGNWMPASKLGWSGLRAMLYSSAAGGCGPAFVRSSVTSNQMALSTPKVRARPSPRVQVKYHI
jgi:hypothetical protein